MRVVAARAVAVLVAALAVLEAPTCAAGADERRVRRLGLSAELGASSRGAFGRAFLVAFFFFFCSLA